MRSVVWRRERLARPHALGLVDIGLGSPELQGLATLALALSGIEPPLRITLDELILLS